MVLQRTFKIMKTEKKSKCVNFESKSTQYKKNVSKWTAFGWKKNRGSLMKKWMIILPFFSSMIYNEKDIAFSVIIW